MSPKRLAAQAKVGATWENGRTTKSAPSLREQTRGDDHIRLRSCDRMSIVAPTSVYLYYDSQLAVRNVHIRLDHSDPSMCTSKCPQPPRTRWIRDGKSGAA
jgi:hypothetical protein